MLRFVGVEVWKEKETFIYKCYTFSTLIMMIVFVAILFIETFTQKDFEKFTNVLNYCIVITLGKL